MEGLSWLSVIHLLSIVAATLGEFSILSQEEHNQTSFVAVVSAFYKDVYVVFYIKTQEQGDGNQPPFSARIFELQNTTLQSSAPAIRGNGDVFSKDVVLETEPRSFDNMFSFSVLACHPLECSRTYIYIEQGKYYIEIPSLYEDLCLKTGMYSLKARDSSDKSLEKIVIVRDDNLIAFMCAGRNTYEYKLVCTNSNANFTQLKAVKMSSSASSVYIFAILTSDSGGSALCSFTIAKRTLPASRSISGKVLNSNQKLVIGNGGSRVPIGLAVTPSEQHHLAFVLHSDGHLSKLYVSEDGVYIINRFDVPLSGRPYSDLLLVNDRLLITDEMKEVLLDVKEVCEEYTTICECRQPKDPKCGWCMLSGSCTERQACNDSIWLAASASSNEICLNTNHSPASVARASLQPLNITILERSRALATLDNQYQCIYGKSGIRTQAEVTDTLSLRCSPPPPAKVNAVFSPETTATLPVTVYDMRNDVYLPLSVPYRMVMCADIESCDECVLSHGTCTWCKNEYKCTNNTSADCPESNDQASKSLFGSPESCPTTTSVGIRVPVNEEYRLNLNTQSFPTATDVDYSCVVQDKRSESSTRLHAERQGDIIKCASHQYGESSKPDRFLVDTVLVNITMRDNQVLSSTEVTLYDCSYFSVCTQCMQSNTECVWCQTSSNCFYKQCPNPSERKIVSKCPSLDIIEAEVTPKAVPIQGGIILTVKGKGLLIGNDLQTTSITIDTDIPCSNISASRSNPNTDELKCLLPRLQRSKKASLTVRINGISWLRKNFLTYYDPTLTTISVQGARLGTRYGPVSGGTAVLISGSYLSMLSQTSWKLQFVGEGDGETLGLNCSISGDDLLCETPAVDATGSYTVKLKYTAKEYMRTIGRRQKFEYRPDSVINSIQPNETIVWGGKNLTVYGRNIDSIGNPRALFMDSSAAVPCLVRDSLHMTCLFPNFTSPGKKTVTFIMDGIDQNKTMRSIRVLPNPIFDNFADKKQAGSELVLTGNHISGISRSDIKISVGSEPCEITQLEETLVVCKPPNKRPDNSQVMIVINGKHKFMVGELSYDVASAGLTDDMIGYISAAAGAVLIIMVLVAVLLYRRSRYHKQRYKTMVKHVDQLESNSRHEIKQAFAELQTDMSDLMSDLTVTGIPYWDYKNFTFKILFPGHTDHPSLHKLMTKRKTSVMQALDKFEHLIYNKHFLVSFIHTLENQPSFSMQDKVQLASLLMLTLQHKMDYATHVIKELLSELIEMSIKKRHPKLLLRRSESVVEKMLTHWLSLCLYKYLQDHAGTPLFMLYKAIKHQIEKGPVDALTGEARYSLSQDRLIRQTIDTQQLTLVVDIGIGDEIQVKVNDCDTPTQVKEKILDAYYKNQAYSTRPLASDYNLEWHPGMVGMPISDEDLTSQITNGWKRLNTLGHYSIPDQARMKLVSRHQTQSLHSDRSRDTDRLFDTLSTNRGGTPRNTLSRAGATSTSNLQDHFVHNHISLWHLTKNPAQTLPKDRQQTMMSEIFLTRLLKTKGTLQDFIDKLFHTIFSAENLPPTVKFLFDFLDQEALRHGISDSEVVHIWKNNSLNLRFWVNIIKNPEFVFDIHKSEIVDASLSTIAQTFIDSCAMTEPDFGADAPVNKLLFAKDRPKYRKMLQAMYADIRNQPPVAEQTLNAHLSELSKMYPREFYRNSALKEIYQFAQRYHKQVVEDLEDGYPKHRNPNLTTLLREINSTLDERSAPMTDYV